MKIKIGSAIFDGTKIPIMVILTAADKKNIAAMGRKETMYCEYPDPDPDDPDGSITKEEILEWMREEPECGSL